MTLAPDTQEQISSNQPIQQNPLATDTTINPPVENYIFEQLFNLGYAESPSIVVYKDANNEFTVRFRTLVPNELRDIFESASRFQTSEAQSITEKLETLARAITTVNSTPMVISQKEQQEYFDKNNVHPSPLVMARIILHQKIKSLNLINLMYTKYMEFIDSVNKAFEDGKKN